MALHVWPERLRRQVQAMNMGRSKKLARAGNARSIYPRDEMSSRDTSCADAKTYANLRYLLLYIHVYVLHVLLMDGMDSRCASNPLHRIACFVTRDSP